MRSQVSSLLAGLLGDIVALDAHIILLNVCGFVFLSFPFAVGIAGSIRVGQLLGGNLPLEARRATGVILVLTCAGCIGTAAAFLGARDVIGAAFTKDAEVVSAISKLVPIAALFQVSDGVQSAVAGVLRGMGRQQLVACLNFVGFWVIGTAVGATLTFGPPRLGVAGLWWGLAIGITATSIVGAARLTATDWAAEAAKAKRRIAGDNERQFQTDQGNFPGSFVGP
mmetsp:Transcript_2301/g.4929  ORF Transcript_2301/g.4929 Transcript_2301/m.4929 type:complete len:225 (+) Transcript_2301:43-717(+)